MLLLLCATLARAADPEPSAAAEAAEPGTVGETAAPAPAAPPVFDVVVVKKGTPIAAPAAAPAASSSAPVFDVSVVRPAGDITPPELPRGGDITPPPDPAPPPSPLPPTEWTAAADLKPPPPPEPTPPPLAPPVGTEAPEAAVEQWEQPQSAAAKWAAAAAASRLVTPPAGALGEGGSPASPSAAAPSLGEGPIPSAPTTPPPAGVGLRISDGEEWSVTDAAGRSYDTVQFARLVGDRETLRKLQNQREFLQIGSTSLAIGGGALLIASLVVIAGAGGAPDVLDYSVDPADYESEESYLAATEFSSEQYDKAVDSWQSQKAGTAVFLAGSGALLLGSAPFLGRERPNEQEPTRVYARADAQRWAEQYNTNNPGPVVAPVAPDASGESPATPTPTEESGAPPKGEETAPPREEAPAPNPLNEGVPNESEFRDEPPGLQMRPLLGPGIVGVVGSF